MRIDRIDLFQVAMPLIEPWRTAYGEDASVHSVLCRMTSGSVHAWGESTPLAAPCYSSEWGGGQFAVLKAWLAPAVIGREIDSPAQLQEALALFKGNQFAKAALDSAWWVLESRLTNAPLHRLLGASRDSIPVGADFGVGDDIDALLAAIDTAVTAGFPRIKLKFRPGWDVPMLRAVRRAFPETTIHIDCNAGYRLSDLDLFRAVDEFGLAMIEQPLQHDDLIDHAELQEHIKTPVCLDESITTIRRAEQALAHKSCRFVNVKPGRVGGLTNAVAIHDRCRDAGVPAWVGGMLESSVGASICAALAMLDNFTYPADIFPSSRFYHTDLAEPALTLQQDESGTQTVAAPLEIPDPDPARLERLTVQSASFS